MRRAIKVPVRRLYTPKTYYESCTFKRNGAACIGTSVRIRIHIQTHYGLNDNNIHQHTTSAGISLSLWILFFQGKFVFGDVPRPVINHAREDGGQEDLPSPEAHRSLSKPLRTGGSRRAEPGDERKIARDFRTGPAEMEL